MAIRKIPLLQRILEPIFDHPVLASLLVGSSILLLGLLINEITGMSPLADRLNLLVPFLPPLFITYEARKIHLRKAAYNFIADAEPIIYLGFLPEHPHSPEQLSAIQPEVVSDATARHLNLPIENILNAPILTPSRFKESDRMDIFRKLLSGINPHIEKVVLNSYQISTNMIGENSNVKTFLLNAVLKRMRKRWKLQMTLIPLEDV